VAEITVNRNYPLPDSGLAGRFMAWRTPFRRLQPDCPQVRDIHLYHTCDLLSGLLISGMVLFCPWAFGTTQPWAIWTMNLAGYALGLMQFVKIWIRDWKGYRAAGWEHPREDGCNTNASKRRTILNVHWILGGTCGLLLLYVLVSALNARATFVPSELSFVYHSYVPWLPHSRDSSRTWQAFWSCLALACAFWGIRDWLLGKSEHENRRPGLGSYPACSKAVILPFPRRLRLFLWLLTVNGALLAMEGIAQRLEGSGRLLFLLHPRVNPGADTQFGPWAYRANAAAWFNLAWPVCLGFWWTLHHRSAPGKHGHHWILLFALLMAACPIISTSRGGALVTGGLMTLAFLFLLTTTLFFRGSSQFRRSLVACAMVMIFSISALGLSLKFGWKALAPRMAELNSSAELREQIYANARPMAQDYPVFGTGAGTFATVFQLYRISTDTYWPAQLHNDWLETRITFGWAGSALIALALGCVIAPWFIQGGTQRGRRFVGLTWLALVGCLVHARYDFPFQVYSVLFLFLSHCAVLMVMSKKPCV
jgi:O-antigen ligase